MNPEQFEQDLASRREKYALLSPLDKGSCHVRFSGPFLGNLIIWDAYLYTLSYYVKEHAHAETPVRQFIDVGEFTAQGRTIQIGLNVPSIDEPVILKTLVMVRQYKPLAPGRHEYGEYLDFSK